ncbi:protein CASPARIAN STRIP INTEGRITY FACTOR 1-like [Durio zibethinus]|uniref:Protein CASPARIAN STRIP INTEGRITY FACTOR 1-like n=1 Tax=Durio zibethinus TaxID=66656 RepID=A0A6P6ABW8_DURZI|nr:protein CASPARIAN STRIP INTEGRITY FACTOR 1-like [Durio zibethinus]
MHFKKIVLLFLLVSAFLLSTSLAGRRSKFLKMLSEEGDDAAFEDGGEATDHVHERVLRVNAKDYGSYDPPPALVKPPFKLIPN